MLKNMNGELSLDITRNVKIIDYLKGEILTDIADLFKLMNRENEDIHETALDILSNIVIESYVLSKRIGISYDSLDLQIKEKLRLGIDENNDIEKWYKDLSSLCNHMSSK